jgi:hypothetical protein
MPIPKLMQSGGRLVLHDGKLATSRDCCCDFPPPPPPPPPPPYGPPANNLCFQRIHPWSTTLYMRVHDATGPFWDYSVCNHTYVLTITGSTDPAANPFPRWESLADPLINPDGSRVMGPCFVAIGARPGLFCDWYSTMGISLNYSEVDHCSFLFNSTFSFQPVIWEPKLSGTKYCCLANPISGAVPGGTCTMDIYEP